MDWATLALLILASYLIGSIPFSYLVAITQGVDLRMIGSGNTGASNVWRSCGFKYFIVALALAIFTAVAAYFFHDFWHYPEGAQYTDNMIHFMKNLSVIGGFLMLCAVGAGRYSLDGPCIRPEHLK